MATIFIILFVLAIWHFVYQAIVLPDQRMFIRDELFALRDKAIKYEIDKSSNQASRVLINAINSAIRNMHHYNVIELSRHKRELDSDETFQKSMKERIELIQSSDEELQEISLDLSKLVLIILGLNIGGWFPLIAPFIVTYDFIVGIFGVTKDIVQKLSLTNEREVQDIYPLANYSI